MRVIGLTGGIASGKSTVAQVWKALGAAIVDADQVARDVVEPGRPAYDDIVATFGPEVLEGGRPGAPLDRKRLGALVFADPERRRRLNAITHPRIAEESQRQVSAFAAAGHEVVVYEAALLVENGVHRAMNGTVVVACDEAAQLQRLMARDGLSEAEARARLASQLPLAEKIAVADWVLDSNGTRDATRAAATALWHGIVAGTAPRRSRGPDGGQGTGGTP